MMELEAFQLRVSDTVKHLQFWLPTGGQPHHQPEELFQVRVHFALGQPFVPVGIHEASSLDFLDRAVMFAYGTHCDAEVMHNKVLEKTSKVSTESAAKGKGVPRVKVTLFAKVSLRSKRTEKHGKSNSICSQEGCFPWLGSPKGMRFRHQQKRNTPKVRDLAFPKSKKMKHRGK